MCNMKDYYQQISRNCYDRVFDMVGSEKDKSKELPPFSFENRLKFVTGRYNVKQLVGCLKENNIQITGKKTKDVLRCKLYSHLHLTNHAILIQKILRGTFSRKYLALKAKYSYEKDCVNDTDFVTLEPLGRLTDGNFFSYVDVDGLRYGFDMSSFTELLFKHDGNENPYNRNPFPENLKKDVEILIFFEQKYLGKHLEKDDEIIISDSQFALQLFHKMNVMGHCADFRWFMNLNRSGLIAFLAELTDIWEYRLGLSSQLKEEICPPHGRPFGNFRINMHTHHNFTTPQIRQYVLSVINKFINSGTTRDNQQLGAYYVLGALTLVNKDAALTMYWLFQQFY